MREKYYSLDRLLKCGCHWMILYGMRNNGKSYAVKKYCLESYIKRKEKFVYLRRWSEDIKVKDVQSYFDDMPVYDMTKGQWTGVTAYQGHFYFYNIAESGEMVRSKESLGRYLALNLMERYKSQVFKDTENLIYEEFLTNKIYLGSNEVPEPRMLMQLVSTIARDRNIKVFMIGNTISRVCPYFSEWGLKGIMQQKPGTIDIYHLRGEAGVVDIAVENCEVVGTDNKMFFGLASKQIVSGEWEVNEVSKLLKPYKFYDMIYEIKVKGGEFKYIMQLMQDPDTGGAFVYIYPDTKDRKVDRVITDAFDTDPLVSNGLMGKIKAEALIAELFRYGKYCFSDNLTGTDFKQVIGNYNLKGVIL